MNPGDEKLLWPEWPEFAKRQKDCRFIAQGTLINKQSIEKTIDSAHLHGSVNALGVRRIFNFALEDQNYVENGGRYERSRDANRRATLNIVHTGKVTDKVNGVLFSTSPGDIDALAKREYGYDLLPVTYQGADEEATAFMFIARKSSQTIGHRVLDEILPNESSLKTCMIGAATYGQTFLDVWLASCYLANGTPLMKNSFYRGLVAKLLKHIDISG